MLLRHLPLVALLFCTPALQAQVTAIRAGRLIDPETGTASTNQVILVEKGRLRVQEADGAVREIAPRESFVTAPGVKHWHGAIPGEGLTQVSLSFGATNWMVPSLVQRGPTRERSGTAPSCSP